MTTFLGDWKRVVKVSRLQLVGPFRSRTVVDQSAPGGVSVLWNRDTWFPLCLLQAECHWSRLPGLLIP